MKLYGILQDKKGSSLVKPAKNLKLSIGLPAGRDVHVYIAPTGEWVVESGGKSRRCSSRAEAEASYAKAVSLGAQRKAPKKLPYFTVTRLSGDGSQEPDFGAIEALGPVPTVVDIVLFGRTEEDACKAQYELWSKTSLNCYGDGKDAHRLVKFAQGPEEQALARDAAARGDRYFLLEEGCWNFSSCPYWGLEKNGCKPHMNLRFQLRKYPLVIGMTGYDTTSWKTVRTIAAQIEEVFRHGEVKGLQLKISLHPYQTKSGKAYYCKLSPSGAGPALDIPEPVAQEIPEAQQAAAFSAEFQETAQDEPAETFEEGGEVPQDEPVPPAATGPDLTDEQRVEFYQLARTTKRLNKAKADTLLAGLPADTSYSKVLEALASA
jgi:hypothetical protein